MTEYRKAVAVLEALEDLAKAGRSGWAWYSPGDHTKYRVHLIEAIPVHVKPVQEAEVYRALVVQVQTSATNPATVFVNQPNEWNKFTPEMWLALGLPVGWWAGVRPLLAALGWTEPGFDSVDFDEGARDDITYADRQRRTRVGAARGW